MKKIGFLGLGVMGLPMAKNVIKGTKQAIMGFDVAQNRLDELKEAGGIPVKDPDEIYRSCDIIMQMLPTHATIIHSVERAIELGKPGNIIIDCSSTAPDIIQELYAKTKAAGMTLLDSLGKRITFLQEVCDNLKLTDVACVHARAEEFAAEHRGQFDFATSRAVANLSVLCELCLPLVKTGGYFLAMKSVDSDAELKDAERAIRTLCGRVERSADYRIPGTEVIHRVIFIKKEAETPKKYPRAFAKIKKNPL